MRVTRCFRTSLFRILFLVMWTSHAPSLLGQQSSSYHPGQLLVQPRPGVAAEVLRQIFSDQEAQEKEEDKLAESYVKILKVPADKLETIERALAHNPHFKFVEKIFLAAAGKIPNDSKYGSEWHLAKISASQGWDRKAQLTRRRFCASS